MSKPGSKSKTTYVKVPHAEPEILERLEMIIEVLAGQRTVTDGARQLDLSRNHFQTLRNLCLEAMVEALRPRPPGRPSKDTELRRLQEEIEELQSENDELRQEVQTQSRIIDNLTDMVRERNATSRTPGRAKRRRRATTKTTKTSGDDGSRLSLLRKALQMQGRGMKQRDAARAIGVSKATLRRWQDRHRRGTRLARRRGPGPQAPPSPELSRRVAQCVRETRGLLGADGLRQRVANVSRRQAAAIKAATLTTMERERKQQCAAVSVCVPGVIRGFDAMHLVATEPRSYALVAADANIPFRTSIMQVKRYDGASVARALDNDFIHNGAPLALRLDRAACHCTRDVDDVLAAHKVLRLHGPPHHPGYYGQLERQNREHRAWMQASPPDGDASLESMRCALNGSFPRRSLNWRTPLECWMARPTILEDRDALDEEVTAHAERLQHHHGINLDLATRLAIEHALARRGYLHIQPGGRC